MNAAIKISSPVITVRGEELFLLPEKAVFWKGKNTLLLADLHLGKSGHFRKAGIPVSSKIQDDDLERLAGIISGLPVEKIYLLGDLFHSRHNSEWEQFIKWRNQYSQIEFHLIKGNHDILSDEQIANGNIVLHTNELIEDPFIFLHQSVNELQCEYYLISGHIHPAIHLNGKGLQSLSFPCFWFGEKSGVLPAFGKFTGQSIILPSKSDRVFFIYHDKVEQLHSKSAGLQDNFV